MAESGFPGFEATAWFGLMAPTGTPAAVIDKLYREAARILADRELRNRFDALGMTAIGNAPAEFAAAIKTEVPYWHKLIKSIGLKIE
ncbi:MAG: hypothetical protein HC869_21860 [Rhodospirillales bacterium]|nr:hypothetical protein [Rhodospirillales bacterium]